MQVIPVRFRGGRRTAIAIGTAVAALGLAVFGFTGASFAATPLPSIPSIPLAAASTTTPSSHGEHGGSPAAATPTPSATPSATPAPQASAAAIHVDIMGFAYAPAALSIKVGDTVTWHNHDTAPHTVTVSSGPVTFASPTLNSGETFTYTFTLPGTYSYYCAFHPNMVGSVTVTGDGGDPAPPTTPCIPKATATQILAHIKAAHLETSPGRQVMELLNVDSYTQMHTVWLEKVLTPLVDGGQPVAAKMTAAILAHVKAAHLETSPGQQIKDLLNVDSYVQMHLMWLETVLAPAVEQLTC